MKKLKMSVDVSMAILLIILMCVSQTGNLIHELAGILTIILFVVHQILNRNFYKNLWKGNYTKIRLVYFIVDLSLVIFLLIMICSAFMISQKFLVFAGFHNDSLGRMLHIISSYMMYILCAFHLGIHYNTVVRMKRENKIILNVFLILFSVLFGIRGFFKREFLAKLQLQLIYPLHFEESIIISIIDYIGIFIMFVMIGYGVYQLLMLKIGRRIKNEEND